MPHVRGVLGVGGGRVGLGGWIEREPPRLHKWGRLSSCVRCVRNVHATGATAPLQDIGQGELRGGFARPVGVVRGA